MARALVVRELLAAPAHKLLGGRALSGLELHERARRLAPFFVRLRNNSSSSNSRMLVKRVLDLDRGDVLAAGDDDVLGAVLDLHVAVRVHHREVAGMEPAAGEGRLARRLVLEVT